jgi:hypothetical protein
MKTRSVERLSRQLKKAYAKKGSWRAVSIACNVLTEDGRPDPSLAQRIATKGYDPKRQETRVRLGLPPVCFTCGQKVKRVRQVPAWVQEGTENLRKLEAEKGPKKDAYRVYARGGKRVKDARPFTPF